MSGVAPILPSELLAKIFLLLQDPPIDLQRQPRFDLNLSDPGSLLGWIVVTYVCRHWRAAALEDSSLWSHINILLGPHWTEQFLQRARMAPLTIQLIFPCSQVTPDLQEYFDRLATILSCHLDHVQRLDIEGDVDGLGSVIGCLSSPAPLLESAVVLADSYKFGDRCAVKIPSVLFAGNAPRLRQLRLRGVVVPWMSLTPFTALVHLVIQLQEEEFQSDTPTGCSETTKGRAGFEAFLCALERLTALEKLALYHSVPSLLSDSWPSTIRPVVALPNLKWLRLHLNVVTFAETMNHLEISKDTRIDLDLSVPVTKDSYGLVLAWLRSHAPDFPVQSFVFSECWPDGIEIIAQDMCDLSPAAPSRKSFDEDSGPMLRMILRSLHRPRDFLDRMKKICDVLRLEDVRRINVFVNVFWTTQDWFDFFGRCRRVAHALVGSKCAHSFFDAFAANCDPDTTLHPPSADVELLLPSLTHLELRAMDLYEEAGEDKCMWEIIYDALRLRSNIAPLGTLKIQGCRVQAEEADRLKDVCHVSWDEEEAGYATSDELISQSEDGDF